MDCLKTEKFIGRCTHLAVPWFQGSLAGDGELFNQVAPSFDNPWQRENATKPVEEREEMVIVS